MSKNADVAEVQFPNELDTALLAMTVYNPSVVSNAPKPDFVKLQASIDAQFSLGKARSGLAAQASAANILAVLKSGILGLNAKTGVDQISGQTTNLFPRLCMVPGITKVGKVDGPKNVATAINNYLWPKVRNGHDLSKAKLSERKEPENRKFLFEVTTRRQNNRQSVELALLLYSLGYNPSDYIVGQGWSVKREHLLPIERDKKGVLISFKLTTDKPIVLHPRDDGYKFVTVITNDDGETRQFRANYKQMLSVWRSDGSTNVTTTLTMAKCRDHIVSTVNKPMTAEDFDALATIYNVVAIQMEKHADLADKITKERARLDELAAMARKNEAIEAERAKAASVASGDEVIAAGRAKLAAKQAEAEAKAKTESERQQSVEDRKSGTAA